MIDPRLAVEGSHSAQPFNLAAAVRKLFDHPVLKNWMAEKENVFSKLSQTLWAVA